MSAPRRSHDTIKLTVRLPREEIEFAEAYARAHGTTVTALIDDRLRRMRTEASREDGCLNPTVAAVVGLVHSGADLGASYDDWLEERHR